MSQTIEEADTYTLVENLAQSNGSNGSDYDRTTRKNNDESHHAIQELNAKMDKILKRDQKMTVNSCEEYGGYQGYQDFGVEGYEEPQEELNYVGGQGFQPRPFNQNYRNHPRNAFLTK
uniref:Orf117 n=1 Tax=Eruca vesicaria subsp. sativa TaxID=29727 RepID=A0A088BGH8_ERUVS|nr:orf117 [Eruca vesicaria subsp. sativa]